MLNKTDLSQIRQIVKEEVRTEVAPLKKDVASLKQDMKTVKPDVKKIRRDLRTTINFFDHEHLELKRRVGRIERHVALGGVN